MNGRQQGSALFGVIFIMNIMLISFGAFWYTAVHLTQLAQVRQQTLQIFNATDALMQWLIALAACNQSLIEKQLVNNEQKPIVILFDRWPERAQKNYFKARAELSLIGDNILLQAIVSDDQSKKCSLSCQIAHKEYVDTLKNKHTVVRVAKWHQV